jgi:hypothetical protein
MPGEAGRCVFTPFLVPAITGAVAGLFAPVTCAEIEGCPPAIGFQSVFLNAMGWFRSRGVANAKMNE